MSVNKRESNLVFIKNIYKIMEHSQELTLTQLNSIVKDALRQCFPDRYWVRAEVSEARDNYTGHCYLEFIEKDKRNSQIIAKARGNIWANRWRIIKPYFERETGQIFGPGIKVLVEVSVEFHEVYGYSLVVNDIDPTYTIGDMARNRAEILRRLDEAGVKDLNKELEMAELPRRYAIISSPTAAGYGDFMNQLENNQRGYKIYTKLFPSIMQGAQTGASIISALSMIYEYQDLFDAVVIIRGGGATSDLNAFDDFELAYNVAQFPLPVITGIGHDRDTTVLDDIANVSVKTPTAVAEYILDHFDKANELLSELAYGLNNSVLGYLERDKNKLSILTNTIPSLIKQRMLAESSRIEFVRVRIPQLAQGHISRQNVKLEIISERLKNIIPARIDKEYNKLSNLEKIIELTSPDNVIKKGYSVTLHNGKILKSVSDVKPGDVLVTSLIDGDVKSIVK